MSVLRELLLKIALGASVAAVLASTHAWEQLLIAVLGALMLIGSRRYSIEQFSLACAAGGGILVPLVPWIGHASLITLVLLYVMIAPGRGAENTRCGGWAVPLLAYGFACVTSEIVQSFGIAGGDVGSFFQGVVIDGFARVVDLWRALCETHARSLVWCVHLLAASCAVDFFSGEPQRRRLFSQWLFYGAGLSSLFALMQSLGLIPFTLPNQTSFWTSIHRVSGLMSDPNALGIVMALSLWCLALRTVEFGTRVGVTEILWAALVVMAGAVSGSRTFLLACAILAIALTWHFARRFFLAAVGGGVAIICAVTALDLYSPVLQQLQAHATTPEGIKRGVLSLSLLRISDTFASRSLFLDIAKHLIEGHVAFGIGAERFSDYVPLVGVRSGLVKGWTDNANNLYVGLLVEVGVVGFLLFMAALANRKRSVVGSLPLATGTLWGLGALMITGPHIQFPEVMILVAFLMGSTTVERQITLRSRIALAALAVVLGLYSSGTREQGVFAWDDSGRGAVRWLSNHARIQLQCQHGEDGAQATTRLRAMYVPQREPLEVRVLRGSGIVQKLSFTRSQVEQELHFKCADDERELALSVVTLPPWSPYRAWPGQSGDRRILGVQQVELPRL